MGNAPRLVLCVLLACGCAHRVTLTSPASPPPDAVASRLPVPLLVERVRVISRSRSSDATDAFVNRIVMELRRTRAYSTVLPPAAAAGVSGDAVRLRVDLLETVDERFGPNIGKAIAVGLSMLLLMPVVRFEVGYESSFQAHAVTCDDWTRELHSQASGELRYPFFSQEFVGRNELREVVVERALGDLVVQLAGDPELRSRVESLAREGDCRETVLEE